MHRRAGVTDRPRRTVRSQSAGVQVSDIVNLASPGLDVSTVGELGTSARVWVAQAPSDRIGWVPNVRVFGVGHGRDPLDPAFGAGGRRRRCPRARRVPRCRYVVRAPANGHRSRNRRRTQRACRAMTPDPLDHWGRDRSIDGLRVGALLAVVSGHWLVTAVVVDDYGMSVDSPLRRLPSLAPLTWALQALAPLFCAAGFAAARSLQKRPGWRPWLVTRAGALLAATGTLVAFWSVLLGVLLLGGLPLASLQTIVRLMATPLAGEGDSAVRPIRRPG